MKSIRLPLAEPLTNRDSTASKDSKLTNCFMQNVGGQPAVVKRPGITSNIQNAVGQAQGTYCYNNNSYSISGNYLNQTSFVAGVVWTQSTAAASWSARNLAGYTVFNNKLWILGGGLSPYNNDVWNSSDGITWTQVTPAAGWSARNGFTVLVFNNKLWVIGGKDGTGNKADVWSSPDGITWTQVVAIAPWPARNIHTSVVYDNRMWVIGGNGTTSNLADVWSSIDGVTWVQATGAAGWGQRIGHTSVVFANKIWVIGGSTGALQNDSWFSSDGITWIKASSTTGWSARNGHSSVVFNSAMWVIGGSSGAGYLNDVWYSTDGTNWVEATAAAAWSTRDYMASYVFNSRLYIAGGFFTTPTAQYHDVWWSSIVTTAVAINPSSLPYNFSQVGSASASLLVFKNINQMYTYNPATATVTLVTTGYPPLTVPGLVYLDGTFYVGSPDGKIWGSNIEDPTTWSALNYVTAEIESDPLVAISKSLNYLIAFGSQTTEFFYDAGNATGSPLSSVPNAFFAIGCASGDSVIKMENEVVWMSQTAQRGRQIMTLNGFTPSIISIPEVDRILNADDLATVYAFSVKLMGSVFYIITLKTSAVTLVYDFTTKQWHFWTSMTAQAAKSITTITSASGIATVTEASHGYADGDLITIAGVNEVGYNGSVNITYIDANTYSYLAPLAVVTPATGTITSVGYTESYFKGVGYSFCGGGDLIQGETDGIIYSIGPTFYDDNGAYINTKIKTNRIDGGESKRKFVSKAEIVGDKVTATGLLRYSDDDYQSWSVYRPIDMSAKRSMLLRQGHTRRRAYEYRCTAAVPLRIEALELDVAPGTS